MLTTEERLFIAARLLSRARHESKKLLDAERKQRQLHPELSKQIRQDIAECARLANKLQATGEGQ
jgi:cell division septum initiation protein DivIVA